MWYIRYDKMISFDIRLRLPFRKYATIQNWNHFYCSGSVELNWRIFCASYCLVHSLESSEKCTKCLMCVETIELIYVNVNNRSVAFVNNNNNENVSIYHHSICILFLLFIFFLLKWSVHIHYKYMFTYIVQQSNSLLFLSSVFKIFFILCSVASACRSFISICCMLHGRWQFALFRFVFSVWITCIRIHLRMVACVHYREWIANYGTRSLSNTWFYFSSDFYFRLSFLSVENNVHSWCTVKWTESYSK